MEHRWYSIILNHMCNMHTTRDVNMIYSIQFQQLGGCYQEVARHTNYDVALEDLIGWNSASDGHIYSLEHIEGDDEDAEDFIEQKNRSLEHSELRVKEMNKAFYDQPTKLIDYSVIDNIHSACRMDGQ